MASFRALAPNATDGPLEIKVVYRLPTCEAVRDHIAVVKTALQLTPDKYVDVLYSPPKHVQARHPCLRPGDVVAHLLTHGSPPLSVIRHLIRSSGLTPPAV